MAQDPTPEAEEVVAEPRSKKKLIIIVGAVVLLAAIGGGAAWFFMHGKSEHKKEEPKHEEVAKAPVFVALDTFTVNLQADPDEKYLQLDMTLQVPSEEAAEHIKQQMPAVRNRLLMLLSSKKASEIGNSDGKKQLSDEIVAEVKKPFSAGGKPQEILGVFFTSFVVQ